MSDELSFGPREWQLAYRVALKVLKAPDQAEDAAQDALMKAYSARHTFAGRAKPESWLYRIAYNTALSYLRRPFARRYASVDVFPLVDDRAHLAPMSAANDTPEGSAIAEQLATSLGSCLRMMGAKDRIAFTERFIHGTSERELGEILGVSANAAKQRAFRARRAVRSCMSCQGTES